MKKAMLRACFLCAATLAMSGCVSSQVIPSVALLVIGVIGNYFIAMQPATAAYDEALLDDALADNGQRFKQVFTLTGS